MNAFLDSSKKILKKHWPILLMMKALLIFSSIILWKFNEGPYEISEARLLSLGVPKEVLIDKDKEYKVLMSDPAISKNWGLMGTGGASDISAAKAWAVTQGSRDIRVAIIDTGIDENHPDIKNNLWVNPDKSATDVHGWNFVNDNNDLTDHHGHGTHIAGIVGAEGGNGIGISGVSPRVSLMILKYYDPSSRGNDNLKNTVRAIRYAIKKKANIINYSGGGVEYSAEEYQAIKEACEAGILFVAAAGNERSNSDISHYYPADYDLPNIISVTAINPNAEVLSSSNYGVQTVHIAAPGEGIFSTLPGGRYGLMTGTSQATAFVSGVAALIMANNREFKYADVKRQILSATDELLALQGKTRTSAKLNSYKALVTLPNIPVTGIVTRSPTQQSKAFSVGDERKNPSGPLSSLSDIFKHMAVPNPAATN